MQPDVLWDGEGFGARLARALLIPASWAFCGVVRGRNALFDAGVLSRHATAIPALSVGNLSVGGTGKTPIAADMARRLRALGGAPALILRGYGDDEPRVHALLNPAVPVLTSPDRVAACAEAQRRGCDVAVLDDGFQHRRARRVVDVVLVAAEQWRRPLRCLPAGRYREPSASLARASLVVVTRKTATADAAEAVGEAIRADTDAPIARACFALDALHRVGGEDESRPLSALADCPVVAVAGVGAPRAFAGQLEAAGGRVSLVSFPDHHRFTAADVDEILRRAPANASVVCTLKDAVKLDRLWPRASMPLWYVSQRVALEAGQSYYAEALQRLLDARPHHHPIRSLPGPPVY